MEEATFTPELKKLIKLRAQRPSYSRMISWELSQASVQDPAKKARQKKKKSTSESPGDAAGDVDEEEDVFSGSDFSSEYETAEEDVVDGAEKITDSSSESLNNDEDTDFLTCSTSGSIASSSACAGGTVVSAGANSDGRRRRLSKKQKRKRKALHKIFCLDELYNLGGLFDITDDIENMFIDVAESGAIADVQRRVPSLVELCLTAARKKPRSNSERGKTTTASQQMPKAKVEEGKVVPAVQQQRQELPYRIRGMLTEWAFHQKQLQAQLLYLQNHVLPTAIKKGNKFMFDENHLYRSLEEHYYQQRRSVFSAFASHRQCRTCPVYCEKATAFLFAPTIQDYKPDNQNFCWEFQETYTSCATAIVVYISALSTTIDLMLPSQILDDRQQTSDWKSDPRLKTIIFRVRRALSLRYKPLVDNLFDTALPYTMWARGHITIATDLFKALVDKQTKSTSKAMYLSEIARMHAQFGDAGTAAKFYRLASETALIEIPTTNDKAINEVTEQLQILLASCYDIGHLDVNKASQSCTHWGGARNLPKAKTVTAIASMDAFLCYHASNWSHNSWTEDALKRIEGCIKEFGYLSSYKCMLYAIQGDQDKANQAYRQCRMTTLAPPGTQILHMLGRTCRNPWQPLLDVANGSPVAPLKVVWRTHLLHPRHTDDRPNEAQASSNTLNLRLNENGHVTGDMQMMVPPIRDITLDPYTGALLLNNIPSYTGTWKTAHFPASKYHITGLMLPTPTLVYRNDLGTTVHMIRPSKGELHSSQNSGYRQYKWQPAGFTLYWKNSSGHKAKLNLLAEFRAHLKTGLLENLENLTAANRIKWLKDDYDYARELVEAAYKQNIKLDIRYIEQLTSQVKAQRQRHSKQKKAAGSKEDDELKDKKLKKKQLKERKHVRWGASPDYDHIQLESEPFVFADTIMFHMKTDTVKKLVFVKTDCRESFLSCKFITAGKRVPTIYVMLSQGRDSQTDAEYLLMAAEQQIHVFNRHGDVVSKIDPGEGKNMPIDDMRAAVVGPCVYGRGRSENSIWRKLISSERDENGDIVTEVEEQIGDHIVWSTATYAEELSANDTPVLVDAITPVGKDIKFLLVVLNSGFGIMTLHNMDFLEISTCDASAKNLKLTEDGKVVKYTLNKFQLLEEQNYTDEGMCVTRLCLGYDNNILVLTIESALQVDVSTACATACISLPGLPKDMCFVGKQHLLVSVTQHDEGDVNYREHVLQYDMQGRIHGILPCLGPGPRSFLPTYLYGDTEASEEKPPGWHVYMRDGRDGILCVRPYIA